MSSSEIDENGTDVLFVETSRQITVHLENLTRRPKIAFKPESNPICYTLLGHVTWRKYGQKSYSPARCIWYEFRYRRHALGPINCHNVG